MAGTNRLYVATARHIEEKDPPLLGRVVSGELSLKQAEQQALGASKGKGAAPPAPAAGGEWKDVASALDGALNILSRNRDAVEENVAGWAAPDRARLAGKLVRIRERVDATPALLGGEGEGE